MADGVPALLDAVINEVVLLTADLLFPGQVREQQWGLFLNGGPVVVSDNVISFEFKQDYRLSNYNQEEGAFETYNKVQLPYDVRLRFSTGGSAADRQQMIDSVDAIIASLDLYDAVTPERVYTSVNPVHQDYRRTARDGVGLLTIDVYCQQVRVTATPQFANSTPTGATGGADTTTTNISVIPGSQINNPQSPSASPQVSSGTVQPVAPTSAQQTAIDGVLSQSMLPF